MDIPQTFMTFMERGGLIMWPLLILSIVAFAVILERTFFWSKVHGKHGQAVFLGLLDRLHAGDRPGASTLLRTSSSPYSRLTEMLLRSNGDESLAVSAAEEVRPQFERGLIILSTVVTAAPMLGILGTVVGIIQSFELLGGDASISDPRQVSGGIAEALITTATGLVIALIALFPYMIFRGQQERSLGRMESLIASGMHGLQESSPSRDPLSEPETSTGSSAP